PAWIAAAARGEDNDRAIGRPCWTRTKRRKTSRGPAVAIDDEDPAIGMSGPERNLAPVGREGRLAVIAVEPRRHVPRQIVIDRTHHDGAVAVDLLAVGDVGAVRRERRLGLDPTLGG